MALNDIVNLTIDRTTKAVTQAGFGTFAIVAEFKTSDTTVAFERHRTYASLTEMVTDGWATTDPVYEAATIVFSQNPKLDKVFVGRKDSADASWATAFAAIKAASDDWYAFEIIASQKATTTFDIDFVTSNSIVFTINGTAVTAVPFNTTNAQTYTDIKTKIEADIADSSVTVDDTARTVVVEVFGQAGAVTSDVVVTGGASQPVGTETYDVEADYKEAAAWAETQKKLFFVCHDDVEMYNSGSTTDLAYFFKNLNYERTACYFHPDSQGDASPAYLEAGSPGEALPFKVGSQTWAYKTIAGVATYELTSSQKTALHDKNCNTYTEVGSVSVVEEGWVASGEFIGAMRGIDKLEARIQEAIFSELVNNRKIPFTNEGGQLLEGAIKGVLDELARDGFLIQESIIVTVPLVSTISTANKTARNFTGITFEALLQGAVHKVTITGTISV